MNGPRRVPRPRLDWAKYQAISDEVRTDRLQSRQLEVDSGGSIVAPRHSVLRLSCPQGPQVADVCFFNADDPTERLWANQTLNREGAYVSRGSQLWSTMPRFRPLATVVADTVAERVEEGSTPHHIVLGAHCNKWMWFLATGQETHPNCYDHLCQAVDEVGIDRSLIHDNVNFFQRTRIEPGSHQYATEPSAVQSGDYVELYAEVNLVAAISVCPMGSGAHRAESGTRDPLPLLAEVFAVTAAPPPAFSYQPNPSAAAGRQEVP